MSNVAARAKFLNPEDARIFRITHISNIPWILQHGLHCQSSNVRDPNFVPIGMQDLIDKRTRYPVEVSPGGVLGDYVPFYFTPWSIMLLNIKTGRNGVIRRPNDEIVILVGRLREMAARGLKVVFTDGHACGVTTHETSYMTDLNELSRIDWKLLQARDFARNPNDPGKQIRYMSEALIHRHVPIDALTGIVCNSENAKAVIVNFARSSGVELKVAANSSWYF